MSWILHEVGNNSSTYTDDGNYSYTGTGSNPDGSATGNFTQFASGSVTTTYAADGGKTISSPDYDYTLGWCLTDTSTSSINLEDAGSYSSSHVNGQNTNDISGSFTDVIATTSAWTYEQSGSENRSGPGTTSTSMTDG